IKVLTVGELAMIICNFEDFCRFEGIESPVGGTMWSEILIGRPVTFDKFFWAPHLLEKVALAPFEKKVARPLRKNFAGSEIIGRAFNPANMTWTTY
ncbi:MAG: hypothetical protein WBA67_10345, partial [Jannaschia sp.]